ncbi:AraC family transcriptional regulator [Thaumasiovibrio subtropicus]|uniref:AraC family transcriptional regulator n=1 Tax=Thaumasiovibrio subtropicus TaxID=1891207 RepID=UPI000B3598B8|nr:AraC family transcriptional regulator [Thaumasiovibrio subtropicus]
MNLLHMDEVERASLITEMVSSFDHQKIINAKRETLSEGYFFTRRYSSGLVLMLSSSVEKLQTKVIQSVNPCLHFVFVLEGTLAFSYDDHFYALETENKKPQSMVIHVDKPCTSRRFIGCNDKPLRKIHLFLTADWFEKQPKLWEEWKQYIDLSHQAHLQSTPIEVNHEMHLLLESILESSSDSNEFMRHMNCEQLALRVIMLCYKNVQQSQAHASNRAPDYTRSPALNRIMTYIEKNLHKPITLNSIARENGFSVSALQRLFKSRTGLSLMEFIRHRRLEIARDAMREEHLSVSQAAYLAGYNHSSNFITAFKRAFHLTPKEYLESVRHH